MVKFKSKKILASIIISCMGISIFSPTAGTLAWDKNEDNFIVSKEINKYKFLDKDKFIEYPSNKTLAWSDTTQSGYEPSKMLDGDENTMWNANNNNPPDTVVITLELPKAEYVTGFMYTSRQDNNISGVMTRYKVFASPDGNYGPAVLEGTFEKKIGTEFVYFDEPIKAKYVQIHTDAKAIAEARVGFIPADKTYYEELIIEAENLRDSAGTGMDNDTWTPETKDLFSKKILEFKEFGTPVDEEILARKTNELLKLIYDFKRAEQRFTHSLNIKIQEAEGLLQSATIGDTPLTWKEESIEKFAEVIQKAKAIAMAQVAQKGFVDDSIEELEKSMNVFKEERIKPEISFTGSSKSPVEYLIDGLTSSHFEVPTSENEITPNNDNHYIELDYKRGVEFNNIDIYSWFCQGQAPTDIKIQYKDKNDQWVFANEGKPYNLSWTTSSNKSEKQRIEFSEPILASAIRLHIDGGNLGWGLYVIDEIEVGDAAINVNPEDVEIYLDKNEGNMKEGEKIELKATVLPFYNPNKKVIWKSSDESVATVDEKGIVKAGMLEENINSKKVIITATTEYGNKSATCEITVESKIASEDDKKETRKRLEIAQKLVNVANLEDYSIDIINNFKNQLQIINEKLSREEITVGSLEMLNIEIKEKQQAFENESIAPIKNTKKLIDRITGANSSENFIIEIIEKDKETGMDVYEVDWDNANKKVILRGNNAVSLATAYNYYLKYFAYLDFPYTGEYSLELPKELPVVDEKIRIVFPYEYRHYFNENCEFKYTTINYTEEEWQRRLDWMAMNGFNMYLMDMGNDAIWLNASEKLGLNEEAKVELRRNTSKMGDVEFSQESIDREANLAKKVVQMSFDLGLEPEIRPFIGQVPFMFPNNREDYYGATSKPQFTLNLEGSIFDDMYIYSGARWMNQPQGVYISPTTADKNDPKKDEMAKKFSDISDIYYESLHEVLGFNDYGKTLKYSYRDLVHEAGFVVQHPAFPGDVVLPKMEKEFLKQNPDAIWLQTSWRIQEWATQAFTPGHLMIVDLEAEHSPKWKSTNEFWGTPWLWSMLHNFGGNSGISGGLDTVANEPINSKNNSKLMKGVSISPEAGDTNPALYELMAEMTWRSEKPDVKQWLKDYTKRRYGKDDYIKANNEIDTTWDTIYKTAYKEFVYQGPSQTIVAARPQIEGAKARIWGTNDKPYASSEFVLAWSSMLDATSKLNENEKFNYDLVDITRQVLGDLSASIYTNITESYKAGNKEETLKYADMMIELCEDMNYILETNKSFMVGPRLEAAKARGVSESDKAYYEEVERTFLTIWLMDTPGDTGLEDYCNKHLSGLMTDYYGLRWSLYRDSLEEALDLNYSIQQFKSIQQPKLNEKINKEVVKWANSNNSYAINPVGNTVERSKELFDKYMPIIEELYGAFDDSKDIEIEGMKAVSGNEHPGESADKVLDNNPGTIWHTSWNGAPRDKHYITIDLGGERTINGLRYLPRQSGANGIITKYKVEVSNDGGENYIEVTNGNWKGDSSWKKATFDSQKATHIKLISVESIANFTSAAEIRITEEKDNEEITVQKPSNLTSEVTKETATLTWQAPESSVGLVSYVIYKDGKEVAEVNKEELSYKVEGLKANTIYGFKVVSKYSNGETSKPVSINLRTSK